RMARTLIQYETLDGDNLERVFRGEPPIEGPTAEPPRSEPETPRERPTLQPVPRLSPGAASSTS
ncbi:MAG: hypothetical protein JOY61_07730, partial [Chloroflexi bacterium]|nr:hypothetical protein [Chloroflexota bacterium]